MSRHQNLIKKWKVGEAKIGKKKNQPSRLCEVEKLSMRGVWPIPPKILVSDQLLHELRVCPGGGLRQKKKGIYPYDNLS